MMTHIKISLIAIISLLFFLTSHAWCSTVASCTPDWIPVIYTNSTTAYSLVTVNGQPASADDMIGAFVGEECRAVGAVSIHEGKAFTTLVIQGSETENVTFKIWDASECAAITSDYMTQTNPGQRIGLPPDYLSVSVGTATKPVLSISPTSQDISAQSGTFSITVANTGVSGMNWSAQVTSGDWLNMQGDTTGTNAGTITVAYTANPGTERTAVVTITSAEAENSPQTITVTQAASTGETENSVWLIPSADVVETGKTVEMDIQITGQNIWAAHITCKAEADRLEMVYKGLYGNFLNPPNHRFNIPSTFDTEGGTWTGAQSMRHPATPVSGEGLFAKKLKYKVLPNTYGETRVTAEVILTDSSGNLLPAQTVDAVVTVTDGIRGGDGVIEGQITYVDGTPVAGAEVTLSIGGNEYTVTTDENGNYRFEDLRDLNPGESFTIIATKDGFSATETVDSVEDPVSLDMEILNTELADLNKDGVIDIADFTLLSNSYGLSEGDEGYDPRADIKADSTISIQDMALLGSHWKI